MIWIDDRSGSPDATAAAGYEGDLAVEPAIGVAAVGFCHGPLLMSAALLAAVVIATDFQRKSAPYAP